jgi:hypothetical protein
MLKELTTQKPDRLGTSAAQKLETQKLSEILAHLLAENHPKKIDSLINALRHFVKVRPQPD